jgi:hypothetical protein
MNIIFQISGGIGKCIASTAVCKSIKSKYPESNLIVVSGYPDVYLNNPYVDRALPFGQGYFYKDFIEGKDFKFFGHDPYLETEHISRKEHLIETWCKMFNLPTESITGELYLTQREIDFYENKYSSDKPILLLQTNGGAPNDLKYSWARDIPRFVIDDVIKAFKDKYNIVHIKREDQLGFDNTFPVTDNFRALLVLLQMSSKRLLMDSFAQHAAAALGLESSVCWIANSPKVFGYEIHKNIIANPETKASDIRNGYLSKYNIGGELHEFPYNDEYDIFESEEVIRSLY